VLIQDESIAGAWQVLYQLTIFVQQSVCGAWQTAVTSTVLVNCTLQYFCCNCIALDCHHDSSTSDLVVTAIICHQPYLNLHTVAAEYEQYE